jgi:hypothetical protein
MAVALVPLSQTDFPAGVNMDQRTESIGKLMLRSTGELAMVTALVFVTGWGGVRLAQADHRHPVGPGRGGVIELRLAKSDRQGDVIFEEGLGYAGWWHCRGNWAVEWRVSPKAASRYHVEARVASLERATEGRLEVAIGDQVLAVEAPDTGGPAKWKTLVLGPVLLEAKPCTLSVRPGADGPVNLNVKMTTLRPMESSL